MPLGHLSDCSQRTTFLKVKADRVMATLLKQEAKGTVQRKDVLGVHSQSNNIKPGKEVHLTSALSSMCICKGT